MNQELQDVIAGEFKSLQETLMAQVKTQLEEQLGRKLDASELKGVQDDVAKIKTALGRGGLGGASVETKTIGSLLVGDGEVNQKLNQGRSVKIKIGPEDGNYRHLLQKSLYNVSGDFGGLAPEVNRSSVVPLKRARARLRDYMTVIPTSSGDVYFQRESNIFELYTEVASSASSGQKDIVVDNAQGFFIGQTITLDSGNANDEDHVLAGVNLSTNTLTTTSNLANTHAADVTVTAETFAFTTEANVKPQGKILTEDVNVPIKVLATGISPSKQILDDAPRLEAMINIRLPDAIDRSEENQIVNGDGSSNQLTGILATSGISTRLWSNGTAGDSRSATLRRAIADIRDLKYYADAILCTPSNCADLELETDDNGNYLKLFMPNAEGGSDLWRLPVIEIDHLPANTAIVGAFREGAELYDRMTLEVEIFPQHSDYASRNLVYIRAERRMGLAVLAASAFCKVTFDSAP